MKRNHALFGAFVLTAGLFLAPAIAGADENYIPRGHAYGPGNELLPPLNSQQDRINAMADAREVEIQRTQREQRMFQGQLRGMDGQHGYLPGRSYSPY